MQCVLPLLVVLPRFDALVLRLRRLERLSSPALRLLPLPRAVVVRAIFGYFFVLLPESALLLCVIVLQFLVALAPAFRLQYVQASHLPELSLLPSLSVVAVSP